jgi:hypothetical protein
MFSKTIIAVTPLHSGPLCLARSKCACRQRPDSSTTVRGVGGLGSPVSDDWCGQKGRKFETSAIITEKGVMRECEEPPGRFRGVEVV